MRFDLIMFIFLSVAYLNAQSKQINIQSNHGLGGYDPISYFKGEAAKGNDKYVIQFEGVSYRFSSNEHLLEFKKSPDKYLPQFGGWCAYAMANKGEKVKVNPKTFEIRNGKLYLFYNAYLNNTLESWLEEGPDLLVIKANKNWIKL